MDWIRREIADGLQALLSLRLKNTPAEDMIELTADIWVQAFSVKLGSWAVEELDAPRIREAFRQTFAKIREWPAPLDVIEKLPLRPEPRQLPQPEPNEEAQTRIRAIIEGLKTKLYVKRDTSGDKLRRLRQGENNGLD